jgi:phosphatidate cytidylyltransferase
MAGGEPSRASDLGTRTVSALVMLAVAGFALWAGGMAWLVFVLVIGIGVWFEWSALVLLMYPPGGRRTAWRYGGAVYCGIACAVLLALRDLPDGLFTVLMIVGAVIGTDIGAYLFGRTIGGPKIAPAISPSKTWAGLAGGMTGAAMVLIAMAWMEQRHALSLEGGCAMSRTCPSLVSQVPVLAVSGVVLAVIAQTGDFFESWMKRKAGVKDSGKLLPGHGGLFDRVDGLLLVLVVIGNVILIGQIAGAR